MLISTILARNNVNNIRAVTRQATSNIIHSTSTLTLKFIVRYNIILADITFITVTYITSALLNLGGNKEGDKILRFCSLLYTVVSYAEKVSSCLCQCEE